ncbi:glycosyltransferase [Picosynechococcus sp. NKBG042902]|uniref:glycosyltransferase n=1 Tax=Picosynechococcus sp. NKBG042902 TaxID=490193 RepID=UPI0004ABCCF8|nr:glycosyltransferase [Picosynechococcus sp. NKBG042902]
MYFYLSIIICTHNPRQDYLARVLEALKKQSLSLDKWELLLIDNASDKLLASEIDLSWHPHARHIREDEIGLTPARLRGIEEAKGKILVFVDDDNLLLPNYLDEALNILTKMSWLGAIGGQIIPEYEVSPPEWLLPYERVLAIRRVDKQRWSNSIDDWQSQPWGAGLVVYKEVCDRYLQNLLHNPNRRNLDRKGDLLISGGDTDIVLTSLELGMGFGVFPELEVIHLIPERRMTEKYILQLFRGLSTSRLLLPYLRGEPLPPRRERQSFYAELRRFYHFLKTPRIVRRIEESAIAGEGDFERIISDLEVGL